MDLNLTQLTTFYWVARLGGFRRAAERMATSQPAISARIQALETRLGTQLFEREAGGSRLTGPGRQLLVHVEQIVQILDQVGETVADRSVIEARLRLGVSETIVHSWLPRLVAALNRSHPQLDIELTVDVSVNLRDALLTQALDVALLMGPVSEYTVVNLELPRYQVGFFAAPQLAEGQGPQAMLTAHPVITFARNTRPHSELRIALLERYGPACRLFPSASLSACIQMVRDGIGVGALPDVVVETEVAAGRLIRIDPGWMPKSLAFTASYVSDPPNFLARSAANTAQDVARAWEGDHEHGSLLTKNRDFT
ncbi:MAG: LysR family transcriptional regulator [Pseudomonadota bacterium]